MRVPFLDLRLSNSSELPLILSSVQRVLEHGRLVMGPEVEKLELEIANYCSRKYAVSVGSGTDALYLGLRALDIGKGDEVITTSLSWIATANAIALTGATPVFADILDDLNIDPSSVESLVTERTKAILAVDYTGRICNIDELTKIAEKYNLYLIEDGSQSFGAEYQDQKCGSFGVLSAISHNPMKVFAACGEAGSILCDDPKIYERLVSLRYNGTINRETCMEPSLNGRMDTLQAAILLERLKSLSNLINKRRENARFYNETLSDYVTIPLNSSDRKDVYYTYTIRSKERDKLKDFLESKGIETKIQHLLLMPCQPAYSNNTRGVWANGEKLVKEILCIPVHEKLTNEQKLYVVEMTKKFYS
jgi:dTDP-4-amino-4,6-dideoxygalactose transaminase